MIKYDFILKIERNFIAKNITSGFKLEISIFSWGGTIWPPRQVIILIANKKKTKEINV